MSAAVARPVGETPEPLTLTEPCDGPWLAIPAGVMAAVSNLVLVGHPHAPGMWRSIDAEQARFVGALRGGGLTPLADFNVGVSLYSHAKVLSVYEAPAKPSRARYLDIAGRALPRLGFRRWEGKRCDRIKVAREAWDLVAAAVEAMREADRLTSEAARNG